MTFLIILIVIFIILLTSIFYSFLFLTIKLTKKLKRSDNKIDKRTKMKLLLFSVLLSGLTVSYGLFHSPVKNYDTAYIEKINDGFLLTMFGKRKYMAHDPISVISAGTYKDSLLLKIPRDNGIIYGQEIPTKEGYYKLLGQITIENKSMMVDLYYDNYDDKIKDPLSWNGKYKLEWRDTGTKGH